MESNMFKYSLSKKICGLISLIIAGFIVPSYAQITLDGSLGTAGALPGPDYMIGAELGSRAGNNLFHSFGEFNINTGESATFTGPSHIENIIGRVTGGNYSFIDGALISKIPSANLYLLNPSGVLMGPNAQLNIDGAFHLSSTDYLQFADGQRFEANTKVPPLLTVAPPEAFGFLDNIGDISIEGSVLKNMDKDLSVTAGNLQIINSNIGSTTLDGQAGYILLQATDSIEIIGSAIISQTLPDGSAHAGNIILSSPTINFGEGTSVGTMTLGAGGGGDVQITAERFLVFGSVISAQTKATGNAGDILLKTDDSIEIIGSAIVSQTLQDGSGHAGNIILSSQAVGLGEGTLVGTKTLGAGNGGDVHITAEQFLIANNSSIFAETGDTGSGGNIILSSPTVNFGEGTSVGTITSSAGNGGDVHITAEQSLVANNSAILAQTNATGNAGDITLNVGNLTFQDGGRVNASSTAAGNGGNITVNVKNSATIVGHSPPDPYGHIQPSAIGSSAFDSGDSGIIRIAAHTLNLDQEGTIQTLTKGFGDAGDIEITVHDLNITHGADIDASNEGNGYSKSGDIDITATGNVFITAEPVSRETLISNKKFVYNNSLGGIYSIAEKTGHGGNITLSARQLTLRENGVISAKSTAYTGDGGNININAPELYISGGEAWIDVSSEFGLNGEFILNSTKVKDDFLGLPPTRFQDAQLTYNRCASMSRENLSRFLITIRDVLLPSPEDLRTHFYIPEM